MSRSYLGFWEFHMNDFLSHCNFRLIGKNLDAMTFRSLLLVVLSLFGGFCLAVARPNVLFIAIDDLNDWIGPLNGHPQALTPNMDKLAARGVVFTNAHCAAPACNPSRAALFSGLMPDKTGVWSNNSNSLQKLMPDALHLPEAFLNAGYRTFGTGKLLHQKSGAPGYDDYFATEQRWSPFDSKAELYTDEELPSKGSDNPRHVIEMDGETYVLPLNRMPSDRAPESNKGESFDWGPFDVPDKKFGDTLITDWAIDKLQGHAARLEPDKPLFLAVGYYRPHIPLYAPARFFDRFKSDPGKLPPVLESDLDDLSDTARKWAIEAVTAGSHATVVKYGQWRQAVEAYLACVTYIDYEIGRLFDALESSGLADNTIIVLWGDHGWHLGEKQHWGKWTGWERSTKVPLIIAVPPSQAKAFSTDGEYCNQPVGLIDLYPTLTDFCKIDHGVDLDGESLLPLLKSPDKKTGRMLVTTFDEGNNSIRSENWRYIRYVDGEEELYNLAKDPNEWENLIDHPECRKQLKEFRKVLKD